MDNNSNISNPFNFDSSVHTAKVDHLPQGDPLRALLNKDDNSNKQAPQSDPIHDYLLNVTKNKDPFDLGGSETPKSFVPAQQQQVDFQNFYQPLKKFSKIDHLAEDVDLLGKKKEEEDDKTGTFIKPYKEEMSQIEEVSEKPSENKKSKMSKIATPQDKDDETESEKHDEPDEQEEQPPNYPQFEDKLKELREHYAKDYEEKINRGFEEIDAIKQDLAAKQTLHETQQVRDLRRELKNMEYVLMQSQNQTAEQERQINAFRQVIAEKDSIINQLYAKSDSKEEVSKHSFEMLAQEYKKKTYEIEALCHKMEDMKRAYDEIKQEHFDAKKLIEQMNSSDFAK